MSEQSDDYKQSLIKYKVNVISDLDLKAKNKNKEFEYGYDSDLDIVIISKDGELGEVIEVQGLRIGLPKAPKDIHSRSKTKEEQYWEILPKPASLRKIKSLISFRELDDDIQKEYSSYIDTEFDRRELGFWFMSNGAPKYITGSHYMYLQWSKIDSENGTGYADYREANTIFWYFWEACKADHRSYGMCYLKNRRSGFSFMSSAEAVNQATITKRASFGILSKTGADAKKMFTDKVVPLNLGYPFFFKPIQSGEERPKTAIEYDVPSERLSKKKLLSNTMDDSLGDGLSSIIDWKNTGDNSYDGQKLKLLVHDEAAKWLKPDNIQNNWRVTKTCLRLGKKVTGKCMMGSTSNSLEKGGDNFKKLYYQSDLTTTKRNKNGQTQSGLYSLFIPMEWNMEGFFDRFGYPIFETSEKGVLTNEGDYCYTGVIEDWENEVDGLKSDSDGLNEYYRQFPRTEKHAFRDEAKDSLFNLTRIYDQIDYNEEVKRDGIVMTGSFRWQGGIQDTNVVWSPNKDGRFKITWVPSKKMQNHRFEKHGFMYPGNESFGAFGCDSYDISGTVGGGGSNGALHGLTKFSMEPTVPVNQFFLEYVARPDTREIFYEEVLMACVFYGMPILIENNKPGLLYYMNRRGYRGYSMNRPDKRPAEYSQTEKELGGMPNSSPAIIQAHAAAIETYIEDNIGYTEDGIGNMYLQRTLEDWAKFDMSKRTKYDASISSGLAIMACNKHSYNPVIKKSVEPLKFNFGRNMKRNKW